MSSSVLERLVTPAWRAVLLVAIVGGLPILAWGELSDSAARDRTAREELRATSGLAQRAADLLDAQMARLADPLLGAIGSVELRDAAGVRDRDRLTALMRSFRAAMPLDVRRLFILDFAASGELLAQDPFDDRISGSHKDREYFRAYWERVAAVTAIPYYVSSPYPSTDRNVGPLISISSVVQSTPARGGSISAVLVAEIDLWAIRDWLAPLAAEGKDIYVVDGLGRLLGRASPPAGTLAGDLRSLAEGSLVQDALAGKSLALEAADPLDGERMLTATAPIRVGPPGLASAGPDAHWNWQAIAVRSGDVAVRQVEDALSQARALRIGLVSVLLVAAYLIASSVSTVFHGRRALAVTNTQLEEATAAKSRFLASMSHDLRTPLNAIIGFSEVLETELFGPLNDKQKEYLADIVSSGKLQLQLVNEILDLSKIESGKMELAPEHFELGEALQGVHSVVGALATKKGQDLRLDINGQLPPMYQDPVRVKQIVFNLLGNAVKFTPEGGRIRTIVNVDGDDHVEIAVSDSGVGIHPAELPNVFTEFERAGSDYSRKQQGSGLGLALVKRFAEMMGGSVTVTSTLGEGSTFTVRLPARQP